MPTPHCDVAIVGAGFAGMYLLHRCRQLGLSARVWEAGNGVGGTWYWNRYPGARCDVESTQYSYQFDDELQQSWNWSERYASQPEILSYAEHVAARFELMDGIEFSKRVSTVRYTETSKLWTLEAEDGHKLTAQFCVMATGCLSAPNWPHVDGLDQFAGEVHHTALWPHDGVDLHGKKVAVIGTGSSGIQSIPLVAEVADQLTVFQRTPNYSVPAHNKPMDPAYAANTKAHYAQIRRDAKTALNGINGHYNQQSAMDVSDTERTEEFERRWQEGGLMFLGGFSDLMLNQAANDSAVAFVHNKIRNQIDDPDVADMLCPDNIIGGKRMCVDTHYYKTYNRENVKLVDIRKQSIRVNDKGILVDETQVELDTIIFATGFDAMTGALNRIDIRGRNDLSLRESWVDGPSSYLGLAMNNFPNLFTVTGPGSPAVLTNMLPTIEQHVEWITDCMGYARDNNHSSIEATAEAETQWWSHVQEVSQRGLKHSTESWYMGANIKGKARVFTPYMGGFPNYCLKCEEVVENDYEGFVFS